MDQLAIQSSVSLTAESLREQQANLAKLLIDAVCQGFNAYVTELRADYDSTVAQLLEMLGLEAPCRIVDTFTWSAFSSLHLLRTGTAPDTDYSVRTVRMLLGVRK